MWDKKGFKGNKGSKGMKGGKGKGKKGKMNEVCGDWTDWSVENWGNQDLWWHDAWSGWYDGSWDVSQTRGVATVRSGMDMPGLSKNRPRVRKPAGARVMLRKP